MPLASGAEGKAAQGEPPREPRAGDGTAGQACPGLGSGSDQGRTHLRQGSGRPVPPPSPGVKLRHRMPVRSQPRKHGLPGNRLALATAAPGLPRGAGTLLPPRAAQTTQAGGWAR